MLDFPPAPKLDVFGKLDPAKATQAEMRAKRSFPAGVNAPAVTSRPSTPTI
jgi:hypothetical protein